MNEGNKSSFKHSLSGGVQSFLIELHPFSLSSVNKFTPTYHFSSQSPYAYEVDPWSHFFCVQLHFLRPRTGQIHLSMQPLSQHIDDFQKEILPICSLKSDIDKLSGWVGIDPHVIALGDRL